MWAKNKYMSKKSNGSANLFGLIGCGIASSLSKKDAYGLNIPLEDLLRAGIGKADCAN
mgnify:CR=1 FL=1